MTRTWSVPTGASPVRSRATLALATVLALLGLLTGCVSVPTSGSVERVAGQPPACQNCLNVDVAPPSPGDEPKQVVQGFLRATSNFQPNYAVAYKLNLPPEYLLIHRVWIGGLGVLCQIGGEVPAVDVLAAHLPGFAADPA
jgi:hypothetical protein